ncbi:MAG: hypothetical protein M1839_006001 [Geoglossum umbratile]|nr:MAG: hypothetical protein M1839_006001 [Geoglossum umbratile]
MESQDPPIIRPIPRRTFEITPASTESSNSPTPDVNPYFLDARYNGDAPPATPSRSRSLLNLTSSTLFGIYSTPSGSFGDREDPVTPCGTGADGDSARQSMEDVQPISKERIPQWITPSHGNHVGFKNLILPLVLRTILLFVFGIAYGTIVTRLHDNRHVAPVRVEGFDRSDWRYLTFWGIAGVGLGSLLPWVDFLWEDRLESEEVVDTKEKKCSTGANGVASETSDKAGNGLAADWNPAVRSVGAFVGIAFAIRKLPWQSTLQVSLTLALVNPVLWYLIDRSKAGFLLSSVVGLAGTALLLGINPKIVPAPATASSNASITLDIFFKAISHIFISFQPPTMSAPSPYLSLRDSTIKSSAYHNGSSASSELATGHIFTSFASQNVNEIKAMPKRSLSRPSIESRGRSQSHQSKRRLVSRSRSDEGVRSRYSPRSPHRTEKKCEPSMPEFPPLPELGKCSYELERDGEMPRLKLLEMPTEYSMIKIGAVDKSQRYKHGKYAYWKVVMTLNPIISLRTVDFEGNPIGTASFEPLFDLSTKSTFLRKLRDPWLEFNTRIREINEEERRAWEKLELQREVLAEFASKGHFDGIGEYHSPERTELADYRKPPSGKKKEAKAEGFQKGGRPMRIVNVGDPRNGGRSMQIMGVGNPRKGEEAVGWREDGIEIGAEVTLLRKRLSEHESRLEELESRDLLYSTRVDELERELRMLKRDFDLAMQAGG